ncbi:MAG: M23 family metallopeptidase [Chloroflexia bacterium]|nr:M23 family metallopeptidase [Chloroflexia bacterium]
MAEPETLDTSADPSGNYGPTEHGPSEHADDTRSRRRMITSAVWGGVPAKVNSEHGQSVKKWNKDCSWYQYGKNYGLDGCQHPGMDVGIRFGTSLFAAVGGKVVYAGRDTVFAPAHVNIETDDGEIHVYGHMSSVDSDLRVNGRVQTGQFIGESGTQNGDHLHFERRVPSSRCTSGYCAVEVDSVLVGAPQPPADPFAAGDRIEVVDPPLNLRDAAGLGGKVIDELGMGAELTVASGPQEADDYDWYEVTRDDGATGGWVAGKYCRLVDS